MSNLTAKKIWSKKYVGEVESEAFWSAVGDDILVPEDFLEGRDLQRVQNALEIIRDFQALLEDLGVII